MESEDRKRFATFAIMLAVGMLVYSMWFRPKPKPAPQGGGTTTTQGPGEEKPTVTVGETTGVKAASTDIGGKLGGKKLPVRRVRLKSSEMELVFSSEGAGLEYLHLIKHHPSAKEQDRPLVLLDRETLLKPLSAEQRAKRKRAWRRSMVLTDLPDGLDLEHWNWKLTAVGGRAVTEGQALPESVAVSAPYPVEFRARRGDLEVRKTFTINPGGFDIGLEVVVINHGEKDKQIGYRLVGAAGLILDEPPSNLTYISAMLGGRDDPRSGVDYLTVPASKAIGYAKENDTEELEISKKHTEWAALRGRYFAAFLCPEKPVQVIAAYAEPLDMEETKSERMNLCVGLKIVDQPGVKQNEKVTRKFFLRVGPQQGSQLEKYNYKVDEETYSREMVSTVEFGWSRLAWLARALLWLLRFFHDHVIANYGICILLITLAVKMALHPLSLKSQKSMQRMQELQPKMQALQKQFKGDQQKMQQAQMRLFKEEGVNPASGCLPMLLQMPVFFALYGAIRGAFVFRQADFLWISDLSRPDATFALPFWPHQLNILPILYGGMMALQMFSQPLPKDGQARQTQMMTRFMPFVFFIFIYRLPSAFVLYFTASSIIGFVESRWIKHQLKKAKEAREAAADGKSGGDKAAAEEDGGKKDLPAPDAGAFWQAEAEKKKKKKGKR